MCVLSKWNYTSNVGRICVPESVTTSGIKIIGLISHQLMNWVFKTPKKTSSSSYWIKGFDHHSILQVVCHNNIYDDRLFWSPLFIPASLVYRKLHVPSPFLCHDSVLPQMTCAWLNSITISIITILEHTFLIISVLS